MADQFCSHAIVRAELAAGGRGLEGVPDILRPFAWKEVDAEVAFLWGQESLRLRKGAQIGANDLWISCFGLRYHAGDYAKRRRVSSDQRAQGGRVRM